MKSLRNMSIRNLLIGASGALVVIVSILGGAIADRLFGIKPLDRFFPSGESIKPGNFEQKILREESVVIDVADKVSPSVVTISRQVSRRRFFEFSPFEGLKPGEDVDKDQDIGTGFIISSEGLIVTNKHVVAEPNVRYRVITKDDKEFSVEKIYRDPVNDLAILQINPSAGSGLKPAELGDSGNLKVGQFVVAIGTALGEFRHTVTTGVISGLGRGIVAGTPFEGHVERLDNVIQTDAAINPGNSGGPLLNSAGQVIGVNVAVAAGAENIGFAIPINLVKDSIINFEKTGRFSRPFLGVSYQMVTKKASVFYEVPEGAYILDVVSGSPAARVGLKADDIIIKINGEEMKNETAGLAVLINKHKVGDVVKLEVWREGKTFVLEATLAETAE